MAAIDNSQVTGWCYGTDAEGRLYAPEELEKLTGATARAARAPVDPHDPLHTACADLVPLLLRALDDPHKFVAAHYVLTSWWFGEYNIRHRYDLPVQGEPYIPRERDPSEVRQLSAQPDQTILMTDRGLFVRLKQIDEDAWIGDGYANSYGGNNIRHFCTAVIDPAQRPALRELWDRRCRDLLRFMPHWIVEVDRNMREYGHP